MLAILFLVFVNFSFAQTDDSFNEDAVRENLKQVLLYDTFGDKDKEKLDKFIDIAVNLEKRQIRFREKYGTIVPYKSYRKNDINKQYRKDVSAINLEYALLMQKFRKEIMPLIRENMFMLPSDVEIEYKPGELKYDDVKKSLDNAIAKIKDITVLQPQDMDKIVYEVDDKNMDNLIQIYAEGQQADVSDVTDAVSKTIASNAKVPLNPDAINIFYITNAYAELTVARLPLLESLRSQLPNYEPKDTDDEKTKIEKKEALLSILRQAKIAEIKRDLFLAQAASSGLRIKRKFDVNLRFFGDMSRWVKSKTKQVAEHTKKFVVSPTDYLADVTSKKPKYKYTPVHSHVMGFLYFEAGIKAEEFVDKMTNYSFNAYYRTFKEDKLNTVDKDIVTIGTMIFSGTDDDFLNANDDVKAKDYPGSKLAAIVPFLHYDPDMKNKLLELRGAFTTIYSGLLTGISKQSLSFKNDHVKAVFHEMATKGNKDLKGNEAILNAYKHYISGEWDKLRTGEDTIDSFHDWLNYYFNIPDNISDAFEKINKFKEFYKKSIEKYYLKSIMDNQSGGVDSFIEETLWGTLDFAGFVAVESITRGAIDGISRKAAAMAGRYAMDKILSEAATLSEAELAHYTTGGLAKFLATPHKGLMILKDAAVSSITMAAAMIALDVVHYLSDQGAKFWGRNGMLLTAINPWKDVDAKYQSDLKEIKENWKTFRKEYFSNGFWGNLAITTVSFTSVGVLFNLLTQWINSKMAPTSWWNITNIVAEHAQMMVDDRNSTLKQLYGEKMKYRKQRAAWKRKAKDVRAKWKQFKTPGAAGFCKRLLKRLNRALFRPFRQKGAGRVIFHNLFSSVVTFTGQHFVSYWLTRLLMSDEMIKRFYETRDLLNAYQANGLEVAFGDYASISGNIVRDLVDDFQNVILDKDADITVKSVLDYYGDNVKKDEFKNFMTCIGYNELGNDFTPDSLKLAISDSKKITCTELRKQLFQSNTIDTVEDLFVHIQVDTINDKTPLKAEGSSDNPYIVTEHGCDLANESNYDIKKNEFFHNYFLCKAFSPQFAVPDILLQVIQGLYSNNKPYTRSDFENDTKKFANISGGTLDNLFMSGDNAYKRAGFLAYKYRTVYQDLLLTNLASPSTAEPSPDRNSTEDINEQIRNLLVALNDFLGAEKITVPEDTQKLYTSAYMQALRKVLSDRLFFLLKPNVLGKDVNDRGSLLTTFAGRNVSEAFSEEDIKGAVLKTIDKLSGCYETVFEKYKDIFEDPSTERFVRNNDYKEYAGAECIKFTPTENNIPILDDNNVKVDATNVNVDTNQVTVPDSNVVPVDTNQITQVNLEQSESYIGAKSVATSFERGRLKMKIPSEFSAYKNSSLDNYIGEQLSCYIKAGWELDNFNKTAANREKFLNLINFLTGDTYNVDVDNSDNSNKDFDDCTTSAIGGFKLGELFGDKVEDTEVLRKENLDLVLSNTTYQVMNRLAYFAESWYIKGATVAEPYDFITALYAMFWGPATSIEMSEKKDNPSYTVPSMSIFVFPVDSFLHEYYKLYTRYSK